MRNNCYFFLFVQKLKLYPKTISLMRETNKNIRCSGKKERAIRHLRYTCKCIRKKLEACTILYYKLLQLNSIS